MELLIEQVTTPRLERIERRVDRARGVLDVAERLVDAKRSSGSRAGSGNVSELELRRPQS